MTKTKIRFTRSKLLLATAIMLVGSFVSVNVAQANPYQEEIDRLDAEISAKQQKIHELQQQEASLKNQLSIIENEIANIESQINKTNTQIDRVKKQLKEAKQELAKQKEILAENVRTLYKEGDISALEVLASSENFSDFVNRQEYLESVKVSVQKAAEEVEALKQRLEEKNKNLEELLKKQKGQRKELTHKRQEQQHLLHETQGQEERFQSLLADLQQKREEAERALIASLSNGNYKVAPVGRVNAGDIVGGVGNSGLSSGDHLHLEVRVNNHHTDPNPYIKVEPVEPPVVSQQYNNPDPMYRSGRHPGIDYAANKRTPIRAIDDGFLYRGCSNQLLGTSNNEYGYVAIVEHNDGHISISAHMSDGPSACNYNTYPYH